jgi:hypothetical protein
MTLLAFHALNCTICRELQMPVTISALKRCSIRLYLQLFVGGIMSYLRYLFTFHLCLAKPSILSCTFYQGSIL